MRAVGGDTWPNWTDSDHRYGIYSSHRRPQMYVTIRFAECDFLLVFLIDLTR